MNRRDYRKDYYLKNKKRKNDLQNKWRKDNPEKKRVSDKSYAVRHNYETYSKNAAARGYPFLLTREQFNSIVRGVCSYCGEGCERIGIDRVDNDIGYTPSNSIPCCKRCNWMKHDMSREEFLDRCRKIINNI